MSISQVGVIFLFFSLVHFHTKNMRKKIQGLKPSKNSSPIGIGHNQALADKSREWIPDA